MDELTEKYNEVTAEEYVDLRLRSGMGGKNIKRAEKALKNSLFTAGIFYEDKLIASGRITGDGGITFCVTDIMVDEKFRRRGLGRRIMKIIDEWLQKNTFKDSYVILIANKPADLIYREFGFRYSGEDRIGMIRNQKRDN